MSVGERDFAIHVANRLVGPRYRCSVEPEQSRVNMRGVDLCVVRILEDMSQREILFEDRESGVAIEDPRTSTCGRFMVNPFDQYGIDWIEYSTKVRQRVAQAFPEIV